MKNSVASTPCVWIIGFVATFPLVAHATVGTLDRSMPIVFFSTMRPCMEFERLAGMRCAFPDFPRHALMLTERLMKKLSVALLFAISTVAFAQTPAVYPAHGQSPQKQQQDEGACYAWAKQNTGIDPAAVAAAPPPAQAQSGQRVRGAAAGAAMGAAAGAIGGNAGHGAAVGAVAGTVAGGVAHRRQERAAAAQNAQTQANQQGALSVYYRSWSACMTGRGYTVQ